MVNVSEILSRCTDEILEEIMQSAGKLMEHLEFMSGCQRLELARENEYYWKIYVLHCLAFTELAERAQGKRKRSTKPLR